MVKYDEHVLLFEELLEKEMKIQIFLELELPVAVTTILGRDQ